MISFFRLLLAFLFASSVLGSQKTRIQELFNEFSSEDIDVQPQLIRMAFHDAAHFDQNEGQYRMGCFAEMFQQAIDCPAHANMDEAILFRDAIFDQLVAEGFHPSHADLTQLLGALAVDKLSVGTDFDAQLFPQIRLGRQDMDNCDDVCEHLPDFAVGGGTNSLRFSNVFNVDIVGKMVNAMGFTEVESVALLGAHTVGRVRDLFPCNGCNGPWTMNPFVFDNAYFNELQSVANSLENCDSSPAIDTTSCLFPFHKKFPDWFQDNIGRLVNWMNEKLLATGQISELPEVTPEVTPLGDNVIKPLMTDVDLSLLHMKPDLVEAFANDLQLWRTTFNNAYVKMSELGCDEAISGFTLVDDLDVDESNPQPIPVVPCPIPLCSNIGTCPLGSSIGLPACEGECCASCPCCISAETGSCVQDCPSIMFINVCPNGFKHDDNGCQIDECAPLDFDYVALGDGSNGFCRAADGSMEFLGDYDLPTEVECKELCSNMFMCGGYQYGRSSRPEDCNLYVAADSVSTHTSTFASCQQKQGQLSLPGYTWLGRGFCRDANGQKHALVALFNLESEWECRLACDMDMLCEGFAYGTVSNRQKCNLYTKAETTSTSLSFGGCWAKN